MKHGSQTVLARTLTIASWLSLALAVTTTAASLGFHWCIDAETLGAHDAGTALFCATTSGVLLVGELYAAPALAIVGIACLTSTRRAGIVFLAASLVAALPFAVLQ